jgi:hypothetical protein
MRLVDTSTIRVRDFASGPIPEYAILSHRWEGEEVSLQDMEAGRARRRVGYSKIKDCCAKAASHGFKYVWIDTCCIDKTSSAELSEAINSMFRWYQRAEECYVYLQDVESSPEDPSAVNASFRKSKWFTRGWTIQELLAPNDVIFYDRRWIRIGTKAELHCEIYDICGIHCMPTSHWMSASIAQKMSWASRRETSREEDIAYCLMGLFGVHMPPLYGEGHNAFLRLQQEIMKMSDDESIFAWAFDGKYQLSSTGILARSPAQFRNSGNISRHDFDPDRPPYYMTNKGLCMEVSLKPSSTESGSDTVYLLTLNCSRDNSRRPLMIRLHKISRNKYIRYVFDEPIEDLSSTEHDDLRKRMVIYVMQQDLLLPIAPKSSFDSHSSTQHRHPPALVNGECNKRDSTYFPQSQSQY